MDRKNPMTVVVCHLNADFDCLGALAAAAVLYPGAQLVVPGSQERNVREFAAAHPELFPPLVKIKELDLGAVRHLVMVDCHEPSRIGPLEECFNNPDCRVTVFDHHPLTTSFTRPVETRVTPVGATVTLLAESLQQQGGAISSAVATLMLLGVYEDTGGLRFPTTTPADCRAVAWILEQGAELHLVAEVLCAELSSEQVGLLHDLLTSLATSDINGIAVSLAHASRSTYVSDLAGLVQRLLEMENLDVLIVAVKMGDRCFIIGRSRVSDVDLGQLMRRFGGGGHASAASATVHDEDLRSVRKRIGGLLTEVVHPVATVADVMTAPVRVVDSQATILDARDLLLRYNHSALPVMQGAAMLGVVTRKVVEKAVFHGIGTRPVTEVMHTEVLRAEPGMPLHLLTEHMVGGDRRFVPVFMQDELVGVVTRTDLLRHMQGRLKPDLVNTEPLDTDEPVHARTVRHRLERQLSSDVVSLLRALGEHGDHLGVCVYVIGGFVRDLLLGTANLDLDLTVEGDGIRFAESFAETCQARVRPHHAFGTAVIILPDGTKIDVASTRLEYYGAPGVLPSVERASLRQDLYRRDFIINTGAIALNPDRFGMLVDHFGVQEDLRTQRIRVLHNLSFIEDPTRTFRAVRFEQRLGFTIDPHTEGLIRSAVRAGVIERISGRRLLNELIYLFREQRPGKALVRLGQLGLLPAIHADLHATPFDREQFDALQDVLAWYQLLFLEQRMSESWAPWFLMLTDRLDTGRFAQACQRLAMPERLMQQLFSKRSLARKRFTTLHQRLARGEQVAASSLYDLLVGLPVELLLYGVARTQDQAVRRLVSQFLTHLVDVKLLLGGDDLRGLGVPAGPEMRRIMDALLHARLDGELITADDERERVRVLLSSGV